jgi:peptidylprolyl isomerase
LRLILALCAFAALSLPAAAQNAGDTITLDTNKGAIKIQLRPDLAPKHAERLKQLTQEGFYNGVPFHRVIDGFMAQTGDPTGTGTGGSKYPDLPAEFTTKEKFVRGTVGMARAQSPNSANSQFFIMFAPAPFLDGKYTIIGNVTSGMDVVDKIKKGPSEANGQVDGPDKIVKAKLGS